MADIDWESIVNDKMGVAEEEGAPNTQPPVEGEAPTEGAAGTPPAGDEGAQVQKTQEEIDAEKASEEAEAELVKNETPEQTEARHKQEQEAAEATKKAEDEAAAAEEANKAPLTADALKQALDARDAQAKFDTQRFNDISAEVTKELYPNGFDTTLKDEQGHVIANAADYKQYIDPNATTEEAERVIMSEQARLNKEVQQAKDFILEKAELKHTMENESVRVFTKYKDYFVKNPDVLKKIAAAYNKTLKVQGEVILEAPQSLEDFYDFAMEPYIASLPKESPAATPPAPVTPPQPPKPKVSDERIDLMGSPSGQDDGMVKGDGSPNWGQIVKNKMK